MKYVNAYLIFNGNCKEAMEFYANCLGANLEMMKFSEAPGTPKEAGDRIIHAKLTKGDGILMASDNMPGMPFSQGNSYHVSVQCDSQQEIEDYYSAFSAKGKVTMPLQEMFWNAKFAMLVDQFGVGWMFNYELPKKG